MVVIVRAAGLFVGFAGMCLIIGFAINQYRHATDSYSYSVTTQCGQIVFVRALQLNGLPVKKSYLDGLPKRQNGISFRELKAELSRFGIQSTLEFKAIPNDYTSSFWRIAG